MASLRDRIRKATPDEEHDKQVIAETTNIWTYLSTSRRRREYDWFLNAQFYDNNQFYQYDMSAKKIVAVAADKVVDRVVINKTFQQVRGIVNFLVAEHPEVGVRQGDQADDSYLRAKKEKSLCDYWYRHLEMEREAKKVALSGAKYGIGWVKVIYDSDALAPTAPFTADDGTAKDFTYGECYTKSVDPFEIYWDPLAETKDDMRWIIHAPTRTLAELKNNPLYKNTENIVSDRLTAASKLKQSQIRMNMGAGAGVGSGENQSQGDMDTVVVLEIFSKKWNVEKNKWGIYLVVRTLEGATVLRDEWWGMDEFPFEYYMTDVAGSILESRGVIHNIREPNRALNQMVSQIQTNARIMGNLNWLIPRGSNVNVIDDTAGQFIEYDVTPGGRPQQAQNASLPAYVQNQVGLLNNFISDIGGMHDAANGAAPFAQASGDLVNALAGGDQNNLTTMRSNFDEFHVRWFKLLLKTAKTNYNGKRVYPSVTSDEFGQRAWLEITPNEISTNDDLEVSTGTAMPYSIAQKQQMFMNLWKEKAIQDPSVLFKALELRDIDNSLGDDEADIERQLDEIRAIIKDDTENQHDPLVSENHGVHIATIDKFVRGSRYYKLTKEQQQQIQDHRQKHITFSIQLAQIAAAQQVEPIKRSETVMLRMNKMSDTTAIERTQLLARFGVQSDAGQIQLRGGLYIQDPEQAAMQAQNEDIEMANYRQVQVSFGDNHIVHIQTHQEFMNDPRFESAPDVIKGMFKQHMSDHVQAMSATQVAPGLVPNDQISIPNPPNLNDNAQANELPKGHQEVGKPAQPAAVAPDNPGNHPPAPAPAKTGLTSTGTPAVDPRAAPVQKGGTISPANKLKNKGVSNGRRKRSK